jgi:uncharacterized protein YdhG (YjbR/CyaY superfamily)
MAKKQPATAVAFNKMQPAKHKKTCDILLKEIDKSLPGSESRIYYSFPVWFIDENPIVGYSVSSRQVTLLFWSGAVI